MAITICGSGAIGGTIAAHLTQSGEAVRCVDRVADIAVRVRPTEVDHMLGWFVAEARRRGLDAPLADRLWQQVQEIEAGTRAQALANLEELDRRRHELEPAPAG